MLGLQFQDMDFFLKVFEEISRKFNIEHILLKATRVGQTDRQASENKIIDMKLNSSLPAVSIKLSFFSLTKVFGYPGSQKFQRSSLKFLVFNESNRFETRF